MGNHVASLLHQDHILRALRWSPKLRLSSNRLSHKFCFYEDNFYNFNLQSAVLKALSKALHLFCDWLEVIFCYLVIFWGPISRIHLSPIKICPRLGHEGGPRGNDDLWASAVKLLVISRLCLPYSKGSHPIASLPRVFFALKVKSWMKNMIASFWELDWRLVLQHLSKESVAVTWGGF